jgi:hypothetical protein
VDDDTGIFMRVMLGRVAASDECVTRVTSPALALNINNRRA